MAFKPYSAISKITELKKQWNDANNAKNEDAKTAAATKAQNYYKMLRQNGYEDIADRLTFYDYDTAKKYAEKYNASTGKQSTRPYLYSLGKAYGMSQSDIDNLISYDNATGEISFGGKNIGKPDSAYDGTSYWNDTSKLDDAFNDYAARSGLSRSSALAVNSENENLFKKYNQEYEDLKETNPFKTEEAKAILAKYDLAGLQGRDNAAASGASSNGGNIDSYAAANALRQQSALTTQGQEAVLAAYNQKLEHARSLLSDMGVNIDRVYNQDETSKNNDVSRKSEIASVTGYVPSEWTVSSNPYMNEDGTIKDEYKDVDFSSVMAKAKAAGNTEAYNAAATARYYKIMNNYGLYKKWDDGNYIVPTAQRTADYDLTKQQIDSAERIASGENNTSLALADKEATSALAQIGAQTQSEKELIDHNAKYQAESGDEYEGYNVFLSMWPINETKKRAFIEEFIKPIYEGKEIVTSESLKQLILTNSEKYNIDVDDAKKICQAFNESTEWLSQYRDRTDEDGKTSEGRTGKYGGMVRK